MDDSPSSASSSTQRSRTCPVLHPHSFFVDDSQSSYMLKRISHSNDGRELQNDYPSRYANTCIILSAGPVATSVSSSVFSLWRLRSMELDASVTGFVGARSMERPIRFFNFNVCSLVNTGRLQETACTLKPDIPVLTGTRIRLRSCTVQRLVGYTAIHSGWGRGCYTNRSTGVSILLGKRFQPRMIKEISVPPSSLAGRGGAIRQRGGTIDLGILAYCSSPLGGCSWGRRKVQVKASQQLIDGIVSRVGRAESSRWLQET